MLADLERDGLALSTLEALTGDPTLLPRLQAYGRELEAAQASVIEQRRQLLDDSSVALPDSYKSFMVEMLDQRRPVVDPDGILAELALAPGLKGPVDDYYGLRTQVWDANVWLSLPSERRPVMSQLWHRDEPEDYLIVKIFVYLDDVTIDAGPLSYATGTHGKGQRRLRVRSQFDGWNHRVDDDAMRVALGDQRIRTATGPAGTVVFADTIGYHKGGHATGRPRRVVQLLYSSPAALGDRGLSAPPGLNRTAVSPELAFDFSMR